VAKPISQPLQISTKSIRRFFGIILELYNDIIRDIGQHKNLIIATLILILVDIIQHVNLITQTN
jgi:hypothetical protein